MELQKKRGEQTDRDKSRRLCSLRSLNGRNFHYPWLASGPVAARGVCDSQWLRGGKAPRGLSES